MGYKRIKEELIRIYGEHCMFISSNAIEKIKNIGGIKSFKHFLKERKFSGEKIEELLNRLTVHHFKHRSEKGLTTEQNSGLISELAHQYIHSLPREHEEKINNIIKNYKINSIGFTTDNIIEAQECEFNFDNGYIEIPIVSNNKNIYNNKEHNIAYNIKKYKQDKILEKELKEKIKSYYESKGDR